MVLCQAQPAPQPRGKETKAEKEDLNERYFQDFSLMFLPNLQSLAVTDIDMDIITSISTFCPELTHLDISDSEVSLLSS